MLESTQVEHLKISFLGWAIGLVYKIFMKYKKARVFVISNPNIFEKGWRVYPRGTPKKSPN
jgi:hypothetical protein